jgi:N-acetyl-gamma-glutamyl-phosphate reductase
MGGLFERYAAFYRGNPLVRVLSRPPDLLHVLGSARADVGIVENAGRSTVFCAIDNLCRGAGSQAVANLNLTMGWAMELGLTTLGPVP